MKLANDALIGIIEIFRKGLLEGRDMSDLLRGLDLEVDGENKLALSASNPTWLRPSGG